MMGKPSGPGQVYPSLHWPKSQTPQHLQKEILGRATKEGLLAEFTTLNAGTAQHLAVLLLGHALAALLDNGTHRVYLAFVEVVRTKPASVQFG